MPRPRRTSEQTAILATALTRLERFTSEHAAIIDRLRDWSAGVGSSGGPSARNTVGDPTGNTALAVDEWGRMRGRIDRHVDTLRAVCAELDAIRREVMEPPPGRSPEHRGLTRCSNIHGCPDDAWAVKAGRCEACYRFRLRHSRDRRTSMSPRRSADTDA